MSQEVALTISDYHNMMNWYELAFGRKSPTEITNKEHMTFRKLSVMAQALIEEEKALSKDGEETGKC